MHLLADESCDFAIVGELRAAGHDVQAVADIARGAKDVEVMGLAREGQRVLLTEDKDFGRIAPTPAAKAKSALCCSAFQPQLVQVCRQRLRALLRALTPVLTSFVVVEPGRVRLGSVPPRAEA